MTRFTKHYLWGSWAACCAVGLGIGLIAFMAWGRRGPPPRLTSAETVYDFGDVYPGQDLTHSFAISNKGGGKLEVSAISSTCGRTSADLTSPVLKSGQGGIVRVSFKAGSQPGAAAQAVDIHSNDPAHPTYRLLVKASVSSRIEVQPASLDFGIVDRSDLPVARSARVLLRRVDSPSATALRAASDAPGISAEIAPREEGAVLTATITTEAATGPLSGRIKIARTDTPGEEILVAVLGHVRGRVFAAPSSLAMTMGHGSPSEAQIVTVLGRHERVNLGSVAIDHVLEDVLTVSPQQNARGVVLSFGLKEDWIQAGAPVRPKVGKVRLSLRVVPDGAAARGEMWGRETTEMLDIPVMLLARER